MKTGTLIFFCGKMGAGKSHRARQMANERKAVLICEDDWLSALYPDEIASFSDYLRYSRRLKPLLESHLASLLRSGTTVVMDFPANTRKQRAWFRRQIESCESSYEFYYLPVSDEICLKQIGQRRIDQPERAQFDNEAVFHEVTKHFEAPEESEGLKITTL